MIFMDKKIEMDLSNYSTKHQYKRVNHVIIK